MSKFKFNIPNNLKYKKYSRQFEHASSLQEFSVCYLSGKFHYGLVATESGFVNTKRIEATAAIINKGINVRTIRKKLDGEEALRVTVYPRIPRTRKSTGVRMGKGKGKIHEWGFFVKKNRLLFELNGVISQKTAFDALKAAQVRMPFKTKIIIQIPE
jgi:large subunit ribosomal protein L16